MSYIDLVAEWADWPNPSPTSANHINVRFYTLVDDHDGSVTRLDVGRQVEEGVEALYVALKLKWNGMTPSQFETHMRSIFQARLDTAIPYAIHTALFTALTGDTREVNRFVREEERQLDRLMSLLPFKLFPDLADQPKGWRQRLHYRWRYLWMRVRLQVQRVRVLFA